MFGGELVVTMIPVLLEIFSKSYSNFFLWLTLLMKFVVSKGKKHLPKIYKVLAYLCAEIYLNGGSVKEK